MVLLLAGPLCDTLDAPCDQKVSEVQILQRDVYDLRVTISQCCLEQDGEYTSTLLTSVVCKYSIDCVVF